jgi:hypothetical protein
MSADFPDYDVVPGQVNGFPPVEKIYVAGKWVGMVYLDPKPPEELDELWMAYTQGGHGAESREAAIQSVLEHHVRSPAFVMT